MSIHAETFGPETRDILLERTNVVHTNEGSISTVLGMLPMSLQSRIGPLRHFRRSASMHNIKTPDDLPFTSPTDSPLKPRPASSSGTSLLMNEEEEFRDDCSQSDASTLAVLPKTPPSRDLETSSSAGINWRFAQQGMLALQFFQPNSRSSSLTSSLIKAPD